MMDEKKPMRERREPKNECPHNGCGAPIQADNMDKPGVAQCCHTASRHLYSRCETCGDPVARYPHEVEPRSSFYSLFYERLLHPTNIVERFKVAPRRCNGCWEVESRLEWYLASDGGRANVQQILSEERE